MTHKTQLYDTHKEQGAKLIPFAGYDMPVRYTGDKEEHMAVRQSAGIFDVSHMGEFIVRGPKALELIQKVTTNDASKLVPGKAQYSCLPNEHGGIVDDLIVYRIREEEYMLVVNASNIEKDWQWIAAANTMNAELIDISAETSLIAVSGPNADAIVSSLTDLPVTDLKTYECIKGTYHGAEKSLIATTGYTGERTYEIFCYNKYVKTIWDDLLTAGKEHGLHLAGLGARDTLRLEMGYMLYGNDIDDSTSPIEAGLGWITKLKKGDFIGKEAIQKVKENGPERKLVGFKIDGRGIPRKDYEIVSGGEIAGKVTSGSISPILGEGIGLGYVPAHKASPGTTIDIMIRNKPVPAKIVKTPFIR